MQKLGVDYHHIGDLDAVNQLALERGYKNRDEIIVSPEKMGDVYEEKVKMFFLEHLHEDEEIRYVRDGQGYFDVRSVDDQWVRIRVEKASLCHHQIKAMEGIGLTLHHALHRTTSSSYLPAFTTASRLMNPM